jgi:FtsH-binding integral membrane protein
VEYAAQPPVALARPESGFLQRVFMWMFVGLAITDIDLSRVGSIAFMALIGLILATIVNIFWANGTLYWITTYAGVAIFAALTAYDMQS